MGCTTSRFDEEVIKTAVRRLNPHVATDLEPLVLNDPLARRAVLDFVKADANCSGGLTPDEFARTFGLSADLFLGCVIAEMDDSSNGSVDLREFLVGMSQFFVNSQEERNARLRDFAFNMMDVAGCGYVDKDNLKRFTTLAYQQFASGASRRILRANSWTDSGGKRARAVRDVKSCHQYMDAKCPGTTVSRAQFLALAEDVPLILAPAALTWATFEHLASSCASVCNAMCSRGHRSFKTGKRHPKGAAGAPRDRPRDAPQDRLRTQAVAPAPERRQPNGHAAPPGQRAPGSYRESRDDGRGSPDGQPWRHSVDGSVARPRAGMDTAEDSWSSKQGHRGRPQQAPSYDQGYDQGYDRGYDRRASPPRGPPAPVPHTDARAAAYGQPRYEGDYARQPMQVRADYPMGDYGMPAPARPPPPGDGYNGRRGGSNRGGSNRSDGDDAFLGSIMAELQQQQERRQVGQSNLRAAMDPGYGQGQYSGDPNIYYR